MATKPSAALRELERQLLDVPADEPLLPITLLSLVRNAAASCEQSEYEDYMGEDL